MSLSVMRLSGMSSSVMSSKVLRLSVDEVDSLGHEEMAGLMIEIHHFLEIRHFEIHQLWGRCILKNRHF